MEFLLVSGIEHVSTRTVRCDYTDGELVSRILFLAIGRVDERCCWCEEPPYSSCICRNMYYPKKRGGGYAQDCGPQNIVACLLQGSLTTKKLEFPVWETYIFVEVFSEVCSIDPQGLVGFYKGITASYFGISETVVHFVIYEAIKAKLMAHRSGQPSDSKSSRDFLEFMMAGAVSKTIASCIAYPHGKCLSRQY